MSGESPMPKRASHMRNPCLMEFLVQLSRKRLKMNIKSEAKYSPKELECLHMTLSVRVSLGLPMTTASVPSAETSTSKNYSKSLVAV